MSKAHQGGDLHAPMGGGTVGDMNTNPTPLVPVTDLPIKAMCCILCAAPAAAVVNYGGGRGRAGACIAHVRRVRRSFR